MKGVLEAGGVLTAGVHNRKQFNIAAAKAAVSLQLPGERQ